MPDNNQRDPLEERDIWKILDALNDERVIKKMAEKLAQLPTNTKLEKKDVQIKQS